MWRWLLLIVWLSHAVWARPELVVKVDARQASRGLLGSQLSFRAKAGKARLVYPRWIPGEHAPSGPLASVVELRLECQGKPLAWRRDPIDLHCIEVDIPEGGGEVQLSMTLGQEGGSPRMQVVNFHTLLWVPEGRAADELQVQAEVLLPEGWLGVGALQRQARATSIQFPVVDLTTLVDSPLLIARHLRSWDVTPAGETKKHGFHVAVERPEQLSVPPEMLEYLQKLVRECGRLFGHRPYGHYDWLLSLSDSYEDDGLEHHQSSDNRMGESALAEPLRRQELADLLAHEYVHVWNGKYRRPAGLMASHYQNDLDTRLLWVYEGLTNYWGEVLAVRCGLVSQEWFREQLAFQVAQLQGQVGARWRSLEDTALCAQLLYDAPSAWADRRRGVDFYQHGALVWLEVDALLREKSQDALSLDDFCQQFFCLEAGAPRVKPYDESELVFALDQLVRWDWQKHLHARVAEVDGRPGEHALRACGWHLVFNSQPNLRAVQLEQRGQVDRRSNLGMVLDETGKIRDVREGSPAARAGLHPGMSVVAVEGQKYNLTHLDEASRRPGVTLLCEYSGHFTEHKLVGIAPPQYPHLERLPGMPDRLTPILDAVSAGDHKRLTRSHS